MLHKQTVYELFRMDKVDHELAHKLFDSSADLEGSLSKPSKRKRGWSIRAVSQRHWTVSSSSAASKMGSGGRGVGNRLLKQKLHSLFIDLLHSPKVVAPVPIIVNEFIIFIISYLGLIYLPEENKVLFCINF